jgi:hypothetical protein
VSYLLQFHSGPDRDAVYAREDEPPAVIVAEQVLERRWDRDAGMFTETVRSYAYERRNGGGEGAVTHYDYKGPIDTKDT